MDGAYSILEGIKSPYKVIVVKPQTYDHLGELGLDGW
jgi:hypothetical protein